VFVFDNRGETGFNTIVDLRGGDRIWTTVQLADPDGDGRIQLGADKELDLFGLSELLVNNGTKTIDTLRYAGSISVDGTTYYCYGLVGGDGADASASQATKLVGGDYLFG